MNNRVLNLSDAVSLSEIIEAAIHCHAVARLVEGTGQVNIGTARALVRDPEQAYFLNNTDDVRDAYLWVTLDSGFEAFWPVSDLLSEVKRATFITNYER